MSGGYIYKIKNKINNKCYVGQTTEKNPYVRIHRHFTSTHNNDLVYKASLKYGKDNFDFELILYCFSQEYLNEMEIYFIKYFNTRINNGYNIAEGGKQGGKMHETTKQKISSLTKERFLKFGSPLKGRKLSPEHIANLAKVRKGFTSEARRQAAKKRHDAAKIKLVATNKETKEELIFTSIEECAKQLKLNAPCISRVLRRDQNRTQHNGWTFKRLFDK